MAPLSPASSPTPILELQELAVNITAQDIKPSFINGDLLKMSGVIPADWELAQATAPSDSMVQLSFANGVTLLSQPRRLVLLEQTTDKPPTAIHGPAIAQAYLRAFPNAHYQGISIAPKILIGFPEQPQAPQRFISQKLLAPGPWQQVGQEPLRAALTLNYVLKRCPLSLNIAEVQIRQGEAAIAGLLFTGDFSYTPPADAAIAPLDYLKHRISQWHTDVQHFRELLYRKFIGGDSPPPTAPPPPPESIPRSVIDSIFPDLDLF